MVRPSVDWRAVRETRPARRFPLAALTPVTPDTDRVLLAGVARIASAGRSAGVGRAAVANWRRRHPDFPAPTGGTKTHPEFDRADIVAWLLAHDKITLPTGAGMALLLVRGTAGATGRFRLDAPWLGLADDIEAPTGCRDGSPTTRTPTRWPPWRPGMSESHSPGSPHRVQAPSRCSGTSG